MNSKGLFACLSNISSKILQNCQSWCSKMSNIPRVIKKSIFSLWLVIRRNLKTPFSDYLMAERGSIIPDLRSMFAWKKYNKVRIKYNKVQKSTNMFCFAYFCYFQFFLFRYFVDCIPDTWLYFHLLLQVNNIFYIYTSLVCLSVRLYPLNVKRLNWSGPNFLWPLEWPQGRFLMIKILNVCV